MAEQQCDAYVTWKAKGGEIQARFQSCQVLLQDQQLHVYVDGAHYVWAPGIWCRYEYVNAGTEPSVKL